MTMITMHKTTAELAAAVAEAKAGAGTKAEGLTVLLAEALLLMMEGGGTWIIDDRVGWVEISRLPDDYLHELETLREMMP